MESLMSEIMEDESVENIEVMNEEKQRKRAVLLIVGTNNLDKFKEVIEKDRSLLGVTYKGGKTLIDLIIGHHDDKDKLKDYSEMVKFLLSYGIPKTATPYQSAEEFARSLKNKEKLVALLREANIEKVQQAVSATDEAIAIKAELKAHVVKGSGIDSTHQRINVSGQGNNCGLYALTLAVKLALDDKPELRQHVQLPHFFSNFPADLLINNAYELFIDEEKEVRLASVGSALRSDLANVLSNDSKFKKARYDNYLSLCVKYIKSPFTQLPQDIIDMTAFYQACYGKEFIEKVSKQWAELKNILSLGDHNWINTYLTQIKQVRIDEQEIASLYKNICTQLQAESLGPIQPLLETIDKENKDLLQQLIKRRKLYQVAWSKVEVKDGSERSRKKLSRRMREHFDKEVIKIICQMQTSNKETLLLLALLDQTIFNSANEIIQYPDNPNRYESLNETIIRYYTGSLLTSDEWDKVYKAYCHEIEKTAVMLTADELGQLSRHWHIQLTIDFEDASRAPYKSYAELNGNLPHVTLCNPVNPETGHRIHWQVMAPQNIKLTTSLSVSRKERKEKKEGESSSTSTLYKGHGLFDKKPAAEPKLQSIPPKAPTPPDETKETPQTPDNPKLIYMTKQAEELFKQASNNTDEEKTQLQLNEVANIYVEILKQAYEKETYNYKYQAIGFKGLADVDLKRKDYINAIAIYNFALAICQAEEKKKAFKQYAEDLAIEVIKSIKATETLFLQSATGKEEIKASDYELDKAHQEYLKGIRDEARAKLEQHDALIEMIELQLPDNLERLEKIKTIEQKLEARNLTIQQIYRHINEQLRRFIRLMILECKKELSVWKNPPNEEDYAIICFGSLARDEATPYSDIEYGILIKDRVGQFKQEGKDLYRVNNIEYDYKTACTIVNEIDKAYFRTLAYLFHIKILNLGETTPKMQGLSFLDWLYGRIVDSPTKAGISLDGQDKSACKTPLGNTLISGISENLRFELIATPQELAAYHSEEGFKKNHSLTAVLNTVKLIDGNDDLIKDYQRRTNEILDIDVSSELTMGREIKCKLREHRALLNLLQDLNKFEAKSPINNNGVFVHDMKYGLYRFPNIVIEQLALLYNLHSVSTWDRIEELMSDKQSIFGQLDSSLLYLVNKITLLRLETYLFYDEQNNQFALEGMSNIFIIPKESLIEIYRILLPFDNQMHVFCNTYYLQGKASIFNGGFYCPDKYIPLIKGRLEILLGDSKAAKKEFETLLSHEESSTEYYYVKARCCYYLYEINCAAKEYDSAKKNLVAALKIYEENPHDLHLQIFEMITILNGFITIDALQGKGPPPAKLKLLYNILYPKGHLNISQTDLHAGMVYYESGQYGKAKEHFLKALEVYKNIFDSKSPEIESILYACAITAAKDKDYLMAETHFKNIIEIITYSKGKKSLELIKIKFYLSKVYFYQCKFKECIELIHDIQQSDNLSIKLDDMYIEFHILREKLILIHYFLTKNNINIYNGVYKSDDMELFVDFLIIIAEYKLAIEILQIIIVSIKSPEHFEKLSLLCRKMGDICLYIENYEMANFAYNVIIELCNQNTSRVNEAFVVASNGLAIIHQRMGNYSISKSFYQQAYTAWKLIWSSPDKRILGAIYHNLANCCLLSGKFEEAEKFYNYAIEIKKNVYDPDDYSFIVSREGLANLGLIRSQIQYNAIRQQFIFDEFCFATISVIKQNSQQAHLVTNSPITAAGNAHKTLKRLIKALVSEHLEQYETILIAIRGRAYNEALRNSCIYGTEIMLKVVQIILTYKQILNININEQVGERQFAAIHYAASKGNKLLYDLLVSYGADTNLKDKDNNTAAEYMKSYEEKKTMKL